ncbi:MAG: prepilin-type N-terminal cleavage/methylation domain-containing protein [Myxococcota bacterium]
MRPRFVLPKTRRNAGFSYIEVLIAVVIMTIALVPAIESLRISTLNSGAHPEMARQAAWVSSLLETTLAESFAALDAEALRVGDAATPTVYSDAAGTASRRLVYLSRYDGDDADGDGDAFTGTDEDLLWIRVALENSPHAFETLTSR